MLNGNLTSIEGTWVNGNGYRLEISADGTVSGTQIITFDTLENGVLSGGIRSIEEGTGANLMFLPKGTKIQDDEVIDASDSTKDRIWRGQYRSYDLPEVFYYRVDE